MTATRTSAKRRAPRSNLVSFLVALMMLTLVGTACSPSTEPLDADVARQLDEAGVQIADLTGGLGVAVPIESLEETIDAAQAAGTNLRIVVASPDGELITAKSVVDRYGGTALSYQAQQRSFEAASRDMSAAQFDRAVAAARLDLDIGDSAASFVDVIEAEGLMERGNSIARTAALLIGIPFLGFLLLGAWSFAQERKREGRRRQELVERQGELRTWAAQLTPEIDALAPSAARADAEARRVIDDCARFASTIRGKIDTATSLGELDAAEMRIGRTAIRLRELRKSLDL